MLSTAPSPALTTPIDISVTPVVCNLCKTTGHTKWGALPRRPPCCRRVVHVCDVCYRNRHSEFYKDATLQLYFRMNPQCLSHKAQHLVAEIEFIAVPLTPALDPG